MKRKAAVAIGFALIVSIILSFTIGMTFGKGQNPGIANEEHRYEFISANENNLIIFDKKTGEYWNKFIPSNEGPMDWEKGDLPI
ncbi:hypothetical protein [Planococcus donghaensis]|uniref:Uncharacterized protein n=1 Tax=Planococcus donghaensis TaxID=414778 RepID=A0A1C7EEA4_9BACL|nr:hypothetical protein [Planococcus donghaensis]ANU22031.1 hypothetical protein BCM40_01185 [Planococcus donghaensis]